MVYEFNTFIVIIIVVGDRYGASIAGFGCFPLKVVVWMARQTLMNNSVIILSTLTSSSLKVRTVVVGSVRSHCDGNVWGGWEAGRVDLRLCLWLLGSGSSNGSRIYTQIIQGLLGPSSFFKSKSNGRNGTLNKFKLRRRRQTSRKNPEKQKCFLSHHHHDCSNPLSCSQFPLY